ncbi:hypothetical protein [Psychrobacillus sp. FSL H8-0487]|uniref:hypothetical protein n=1 Tax=Psychrobacillus sp. FSL H8-0487 TaxID=2921391 RepID=UPI0030F84533
MEIFLWDKYGEEVNEKTKYWVDVWVDLIDNYNKNAYGLKLINPHIIINEIIDEIISNKMRNKENKSYLLKQINIFLESDKVIIQKYKSEFITIREYWIYVKILDTKRLSFFLHNHHSWSVPHPK